MLVILYSKVLSLHSWVKLVGVNCLCSGMLPTSGSTHVLKYKEKYTKIFLKFQVMVPSNNIWSSYFSLGSFTLKLASFLGSLCTHIHKYSYKDF